MAITFEKAVRKVHKATGAKVFVAIRNAYSDGVPAGFSQRAVVVLLSKATGTSYYLRFSDRGRGDERIGTIHVAPITAKADAASDYFPGSHFHTVSAALRYLGYMGVTS